MFEGLVWKYRKIRLWQEMMRLKRNFDNMVQVDLSGEAITSRKEGMRFAAYYSGVRIPWRSDERHIHFSVLVGDRIVVTLAHDPKLFKRHCPYFPDPNLNVILFSPPYREERPDIHSILLKTKVNESNSCHVSKTQNELYQVTVNSVRETNLCMVLTDGQDGSEPFTVTASLTATNQNGPWWNICIRAIANTNRLYKKWLSTDSSFEGFLKDDMYWKKYAVATHDYP